MKKILKNIIVLSSLLITMSMTTDSKSYKDLTDRAVTENKNIAIYFCGSDWCAICNKYKKNVLN